MENAVLQHFVAAADGVMSMERIAGLKSGFLAFLAASLFASGCDSLSDKKSLEDSSRAFVESNIPAITDQWREDELKNMAVSQLANEIKANPEKMSAKFAEYRRLGSIKSLGGYDGSVFQQTSQGGRNAVFASYKTLQRFENGDALIVVQLVQEDGQWRILGFNVKSKLKGD